MTELIKALGLDRAIFIMACICGALAIVRNEIDRIGIKCPHCKRRLSKIYVTEDTYYYYCAHCESEFPW